MFRLQPSGGTGNLRESTGAGLGQEHGTWPTPHPVGHSGDLSIVIQGIQGHLQQTLLEVTEAVSGVGHGAATLLLQPHPQLGVPQLDPSRTLGGSETTEELRKSKDRPQ